MEWEDHSAVGRRQEGRSSEAFGSTEGGHLRRGRGRPRPVNWELKDERGVSQPWLRRKETVVIKCMILAKCFTRCLAPGRHSINVGCGV